MNPFEHQFLIAQLDTESGPWAFYIEGREVYSNSDLGTLLNWLRHYFGYDLPVGITVKVQPLTPEECGFVPVRPMFLVSDPAHPARALCKHGKGPLCPECASPQPSESHNA